MPGCCDDKSCALEALQRTQRATLKTVLWINALMFVVVLAMGLYAGSAAVMSDSLDNLGDALTYGLSLYAVARGGRAKARIAVFKGCLILGAGVFVLAQVAVKAVGMDVPVFEYMGAASVLGLVANGACLALLWRHRAEDVNMSSVWHCSRNDIASNLSVLLAAAGVWATQSAWPDLLVGLGLALLFFWSAYAVLRDALRQLAAARWSQPLAGDAQR
jgi:Co/Zn/Cd efflux system component